MNGDTPGFEAVETAMVLVRPPAGESGEEVEVGSVESFEDFAAVASVTMDAFEFPEAMRAEILAELPQRWSEYSRPGNPIASTSPGSGTRSSAPPARPSATPASTSSGARFSPKLGFSPLGEAHVYADDLGAG